MNKFKSGMLVVVALTFSNMMKAQTVDEGKKFIYYEKYRSAKNVLDKVVAADPANMDAAYYLGQADLGLDNLPEAKALYQKTLMANSNSALILAGIGHVELLEGKVQDARQHFETAISLSQGKNIAVLNAIGLANSNADSKNGDPAYAIDKLKQAINLKGMKDPDVFANLGDAYRKNGDGGSAQTAYESALTLDPHYARAKFRIGKIYLTQGIAQEDIYMKYFNDAIALDNNYGPVYKTLYQVYYNTNVISSAGYLDKYLAIMGDDEAEACFLRASMKYAQALFNDALTEADKCIAASSNPVPNLYGLKGYAYLKLKDSMNAKNSFEQYLKKQKTEKIGTGDLSTYAGLLLKYGNDSLAAIYTDKAVALDSVEANKAGFLKNIASFYESQRKFKDAAAWYEKIIGIKKNPSKTDLYNAGYNYFRVGEYNKSISIFDAYSQKFPDDPFSFYMKGKSKWAIDSTLSLALANPEFEKAIQLGLADSVKYKNQLIGSYKYFVVYNVSAKKDKATALSFCDKILSLDPAESETLGNKTAIGNMNFNQPAGNPKTTKPAPAKTPAKEPAAGKKN